MNESKRKTFGTIFGIVLFVFCVLFVTYAWYVWRSQYTNVNANITDESTVNFSPNTLTVNASGIGPILDYRDENYYIDANKGKYLAYADFTATNNTDKDYKIIASLNITSISDVLRNEGFKYVLLRKNTANGVYNDVVVDGDFSDFVVGNNALVNNEIISSNTTYYYRFVAYIDGNIYNSNDMMNGSLKSFLKLSSEEYRQIPLSEAEVGTYVSMTPTKASYTTDKTKTGYTSTQTINPQELNLWRVLNVNDDGTVDIISEYVSSVNINFSGLTGYQNFVGYLNVLASQYENDDYTWGSRYFGYNGQTEYITDTSKFTNPAPWTCSTGDTCSPAPIENQGGGDTLYTRDSDLVNTVLGTRVATNPSGTATRYWVASRDYFYEFDDTYYWDCRFVHNSGYVSSDSLYDYEYDGFIAYSPAYALRPILTINMVVGITGGSGTKGDPYQLGV